MKKLSQTNSDHEAAKFERKFYRDLRKLEKLEERYRLFVKDLTDDEIYFIARGVLATVYNTRLRRFARRDAREIRGKDVVIDRGLEDGWFERMMSCGGYSNFREYRQNLALARKECELDNLLDPVYARAQMLRYAAVDKFVWGEIQL